MRDLSRRRLASYQPCLLPAGDTRAAAVLLLLYEHDGEEQVLFQVRTQRVLHHRGEISLPGGARAAHDDSLLATALRETHEEIGVEPEHVEVFGRLDDVATRSSNYTIASFAGAISRPGPYPFRCSELEVDELLRVPLSHLMHEEAVEWSVREIDGERMAERSFRYGEHLIWGATARIVGQYLDLITGGGA